ncbi:MAG: hypothetical protein JWR50_2796 [Mucilaginibacter sp.]|nr:hypothetical protein [Mucilaginibacter sp.]
MSELFRKIVFGDADIREYATVTIKDNIQEQVLLEFNGIRIDVSKNQWLLCLDPIVFGVWLTKENEAIETDEKSEFKLHFLTAGRSSDIAAVTLTYFDSIQESDGTLLLLKLNESKIYHLDALRTRLLFNKYYKKPKLSFFQLKGFAAAYSYPRKVRVISFKQDDYYNIFPMDLLGTPQTGKRYVLGLRHTNSALAKIITTKKLVISEVSYKYKDVIYQLGSHHVDGPPPVEKLPFKIIASKSFGFYIPEWVDGYKEINIVKTVNLGSHMLLWGEIANECHLKPETSNLYHIHYLLYLYQKRKDKLYPSA